MSTINDLKAKSLRALGYTGSIDDMYRSYLRAISGSSLNSVDDLEKLVLGGSGSINDRWKAHLDISGIRGRAMDNMLREYWSTLGAGALGTAYLFRNNEVGVWYDPSDFSTMFQDSAGTTAVTAVGQPVGKILDKSGRGNHATQSTSTARPVLQQDANGRYYLAFDGVDDFLVTSAINFTANGKLSCHVGVTANNAVGPPGIVGLGLSYSALSGNWVVQPTFRAILRYGAGLNAIPEDAITATYPTTRVVSLIGEHGVTDWTLRVDGVAGTPVVSTAQNMSNQQIYLGVSATAYLNGRIYSVIVRGALSDAAQIAAAEAYVNSKTAAY